MCDACLDRARRLGDLIVHFESLASQAGEPVYAQRLTRTIAELRQIADQLSRTCGDDVVWADGAEPAPGGKAGAEVA